MVVLASFLSFPFKATRNLKQDRVHFRVKRPLRKMDEEACVIGELGKRSDGQPQTHIDGAESCWLMLPELGVSLPFPQVLSSLQAGMRSWDVAGGCGGMGWEVWKTEDLGDTRNKKGFVDAGKAWRAAGDLAIDTTNMFEGTGTGNEHCHLLTGISFGRIPVLQGSSTQLSTHSDRNK